jgi:hypothetical protein
MDYRYFPGLPTCRAGGPTIRWIERVKAAMPRVARGRKASVAERSTELLPANTTDDDC